MVVEDNCVLIRGMTEDDLVRGADRVAFGMLKIIPQKS